MFPQKNNLDSPLSVPNKQMTHSFDSDVLVSNDFSNPNVEISVKKEHDSLKIFFVMILILSIMILSIAFVYKLYLSSQIKKIEEKMSSYENNPSLLFVNNNLNEIKNYSDRLKLIDDIYDKHIYVGQMLLPILESIVESNNNSYAYFNKFSVINGDKSINVNLSGVAIDFETLIRQIRNFKSDKYKSFIENFKLNSFSLDDSGNVLFDITFNVNINNNKFKEFKDLLSKDIINNDNLHNNENKTGPLFKNIRNSTNTIPIIISTENSTNTIMSTSTQSTTTINSSRN